MKKLLIGGAALLASAAAIAQVAPASLLRRSPGREGAYARRSAVQSRRAFRKARHEPRRLGHQGRGRRGHARRSAPISRTREGAPRRSSRKCVRAARRQPRRRDQPRRMGCWCGAARAAHGLTRPRRRRPPRWPRACGTAEWAASAATCSRWPTPTSDGRVTLQEAQAAALRHFDMADANRDGQITPDERRQMHRADARRASRLSLLAAIVLRGSAEDPPGLFYFTGSGALRLARRGAAFLAGASPIFR